MIWYITERSGARPRPPATTTTSLPCTSSMGQELPNGPRTPSMSPALSSRIARDTAPTARVVCTRGTGRSGSPLMEMGISPTPYTYSMLNWPQANGDTPSPSHGSSSSVYVSGISECTCNTLYNLGSIGSYGVSLICYQLSV